MVAAKIGILFLILLAAGLLLLKTRRWSGGSEGRRPSHRHWIVRLVCGVIGGGILLAFLIVTVRDVRAIQSSAVPLKLRVPTLPPPGMPPQGNLQNGRFQLQMVLAQAGGFPGHAIASESYELRWPKDRFRSYHFTVHDGDRWLDLDMQVDGIEVDRRKRLDFRGTMGMAFAGPGTSQSRSGGFDVPRVMEISGSPDEKRLFSIGRLVGEDLQVLVDLTPIREEDPLRPASLEEWIALRGEAAWGEEIRFDRFHSKFEGDRSSPAESLFRLLGINVIPALIAALLLAQLSRQRSLAFVKVAACIILYCGALDRLSLRLAETRVNDSSAPLESRMAACAQLQGTSFFKTTARADLRRIAAEPASPKPLRGMAERLIDAEK